MRDPEAFEAQFSAAVNRYLEGAPTTVDAVALAHIASTSTRSIGLRGLLSVRSAGRLLLIAALSGAIYLAMAFATRSPDIKPLGCASSDVASSPAPAPPPSGSGTWPIDPLWTATGDPRDPMRFVRPYGFPEGGRVAIDPWCQIWVADNDRDRFAIFTADGAFIQYWGAPGVAEGQFHLRASYGDGFGSIVFGPEGTFYVLDVGNRRVQQFDANRSFVRYLGSGTFVDPTGLAVDSTGRVLVLDGGRNIVQFYDGAGNEAGSFRPRPQTFQADDITVDSHDDIYVTNASGTVTVPTEVWKYDSKGNSLGTIVSYGIGFNSQLSATVIDEDGRLFVATGPLTNPDRIVIYDSEGKLLGSIGTPAPSGQSLGHGFILGMALDGLGHLYITDGESSSLLKLQLPPVFVP